MKCTHYTIHTSVPQELTVALCSDLHDNPCDAAVALLEARQPDLIAIPGDVGEQVGAQNSMRFLRACARIAPTVYSLGNHDKAFDDDPQTAAQIRATGVQLLDDSDIFLCGMWIGGLTTGFRGRRREGLFAKTPPPNLTWLDEHFCKRPGFKLLLSHHPEYYPAYLRERDIQLVLSGHAHGGQWRFFGQGILAPGQGLFPRYTEGVHEDRCVISRGMGDHTPIPRLFNPHEIVMIRLIPRQTAEG